MYRFPVLVAAFASLMAYPHQAPAQLTGQGCSILGNLAWSYTVARLTEHGGASTSHWLPTHVDYNRLQVCEYPSLAASGGYAAAMAQFGMPVRWSYLNNQPTCDQADISGCFPIPQTRWMSQSQSAVSGQVWADIRGSIGVHMPFGTASGRSFFTVDSLVQSLTGHGPVQSGNAWISR